MACAVPGQAEMVLSQGTNLAVDVSQVDGRLAIDLLGSIWIVPADGGRATILGDNLLPASRPRWSSVGNQILYQTQNGGRSQIWAVDLEGANSSKISDGTSFDQHPEWHPDGERIVFSSARGTSGFDIWETYLNKNFPKNNFKSLFRLHKITSSLYVTLHSKCGKSLLIL